MNKKLEQVLIDDFPHMFENMYGPANQTCLAFGIECGDGWLRLIHNLCKEIQAELVKDGKVKEFKVDQVKEKFGTLRFYYSGYDSDKISELVEDAEERSATICEVCGLPGKIINGGWLKVRCMVCNK
jgi:hypothetical protein